MKKNTFALLTKAKITNANKFVFEDIQTIAEFANRCKEEEFYILFGIVLQALSERDKSLPAPLDRIVNETIGEIVTSDTKGYAFLQFWRDGVVLDPDSGGVGMFVFKEEIVSILEEKDSRKIFDVINSYIDISLELGIESKNIIQTISKFAKTVLLKWLKESENLICDNKDEIKRTIDKVADITIAANNIAEFFPDFDISIKSVNLLVFLMIVLEKYGMKKLCD